MGHSHEDIWSETLEVGSAGLAPYLSDGRDNVETVPVVGLLQRLYRHTAEFEAHKPGSEPKPACLIDIRNAASRQTSGVAADEPASGESCSMESSCVKEVKARLATIISSTESTGPCC